MASTMSHMSAASEDRDPGAGAASAKMDEARHEATELARDARAEAQRTMAEGRRQLQVQAEEQARHVASSLKDIGRQLHGMADNGAPAGGMLVDAARQLADRVSAVADRLDGGGLQASLEDLRRYARNHPAMFLAGALGAGMVVGRVLRASDLHAVGDAARAATTGTATEPSIDLRDTPGHLDTARDEIGPWAYGETTEVAP